MSRRSLSLVLSLHCVWRLWRYPCPSLRSVHHTNIRYRHRPHSKRKFSRNSLRISEGATKRARYWLGDNADVEDVADGRDDDDEVIHEPGDDEVDAEEYPDIREASVSSYLTDDDDYDVDLNLHREKSAVRGVSEHIAESMEV